MRLRGGGVENKSEEWRMRVRDGAWRIRARDGRMRSRDRRMENETEGWESGE